MALTKINTNLIANNTIAVTNIADNAVDATKIASNSILTRHIDDDQITGDQLADNLTIAGTLGVTGEITTTAPQFKYVSNTDSNVGLLIRDETYVSDEADITATRLASGSNLTLGLAGQNGINYYVGGSNVASLNSSGNATFAGTLTSSGAINVTNGYSTLSTSTSWGAGLTIKQTNDDASPAYLSLHKDPASGGSTMADGDYIGFINMKAKDDAGNAHTYVELSGVATDVSNGAETSKFTINTWGAGTEYGTNLVATGGKVGIGTASPTGTLEIQQAQITDQYDRDSFLRLHPSAHTNSGGFTNIMFGTSTTNNYGVAIGGLRAGTNDAPSFSIRMLNDSISGTEAMRIDASGNLLVGTTSNSVYNDASGTGIALNAGEIQIAGTGTPLYANRQGSNGDIIDFRKDGASVGVIGVVNDDRMVFATADGLGLQFDKDNNRIVPCDADGAYNSNVELGDSSLEFKNIHLSGYAHIGGNVLVGTTSEYSGTNANLTVVDQIDVGTDDTSGGHIWLTRNAATGTIGNIGGKWTGYSVGPYINFQCDNVGGGAQAGSMRFYTTHSNSSAERIRIDSSGNVLVGTDESNPTSSSVNVAGQAFSTTGGVRSTVASNPAATFNRKTDDGDAVLFRKDGTTIGSIGVDFSDNLYISGKSDHAGIMFSNIEMYPYQNGTYRDATLDIGASSGRWKDLYLSGGAFLGGTGSANKLDDYEEGTWTPNWAGLGNGSTSGTYTKIGRLVHITALFTYGSTTDIGTKLEATNLPFSAQQITYGLTRMENYQQNSYIGAARASGTQFRGYVFNTSGDAATEMTVNTTRPFTWGEDDYAQLSVTYYTN